MELYQRGERIEIIRELTTEERRVILGNINQNMMAAPQNYPNVDFYFFYSPYSIVWWDNIKNCGMVDFYIEIMEMLAKEAFKFDNIKLFDFCSNYEMVCNLNNYKDDIHYSAEINSKILDWMEEEKYLVTEDNYKRHFEELKEFYQNYNYDKIFDN